MYGLFLILDMSLLSAINKKSEENTPFAISQAIALPSIEGAKGCVKIIW